jgi:prevent-host-death family protein
MKHLTASAARRDFDVVLDEIARFHEPIAIVSNDDKAAVIVDMDEWNSIQETLRLQAIPGMTASIKAAAAEPLECGVPAAEVDFGV